MARCVGDDEAPPVGREIAVRDIDRDALLALRLQAVDEQRQVDARSLRTVVMRVGGDGGELILEDALRLEQQPADQRRLAVVDTAAGDEPDDAAQK